MVEFVIALLAILAAGPLENEGGRKAIEDKGVYKAGAQAVEDTDASSLKGNYGNK